MKGFKNFLMQGELIVIAVGLVVALAFSTLIKAFSDNIITPLINSVRRRRIHGKGTRLDPERPANQSRRVHLVDRLLRDLHGRRLLHHRGALSQLHAATRHDGVRPSRAEQDVSLMPLGRDCRWRRPSASSAGATSPPNRRH